MRKLVQRVRRGEKVGGVKVQRSTKGCESNSKLGFWVPSPVTTKTLISTCSG